MKLASLHIDRFGARWNLHLGELSEGLNVVYGPNGSGKTTSVAFLRWMLFGRAPQLEGYLAGSAQPCRGSLTLVTPAGGRQTVVRQDGGAQTDSLRWDPPIEPASSAWSPISPLEFDLLYAAPADGAHPLPQLLQYIADHLPGLAPDPAASAQLDRLEDHYHALDRQLASLALPLDPVPLRQRLGELSRRIDALQVEGEQRRYEIQDALDRIERQIALTVARQHAIHSRLEPIDREIRRRLDEARGEVDGARRVRDAARIEQQRWAEQLEQQIRHWSRVRAEVRQRLEQLAEPPGGTSSPAFSHDLPQLQAMVEMVRSTQADLRLHLDADRDPVAVDAQVAQWNARLAEALDALRQDASHLAEFLHRVRRRERQQLEAMERDHLRWIEQAFGELLERLSARHAELTAPHPASAGCLQATGTADPLAAPYRWMEWHVGEVRRERDELQLQRAAVERELAEHFQMRDRLRSELAELPDWRYVDEVRREREEVQRQLDAWEDQEALRRERSELAARIARIRRQLEQATTLLDDASHHLRELSGGAYGYLRLAPNGQIEILDERQTARGWEQLSRGARDQVYLSLCVAAVMALRGKRISFPLVLSDALAYCDATRLAAASRWLQSLARQGLQIILLTRHEHVLEAFRTLDARLFSLRPRPVESAAVQGDSPRQPARRPEPASADPPTTDRPAPTSRPRFQWVTRWEEGRPQRRGSSSTAAWPIRAGVAGLTLLEAQLLIECGIDDVAMLAGLEVEAVARRIEAYLARPALQPRYGTAADYSPHRIRGWIAAARELVAAPPRSPRLYRDEPAAPSADPLPARMPAADVGEPLRFFLEPRDAIVDAPAIGPRTAQRLQQHGIQSVADLLASDPHDLAERLGHKRIGAETIERWQTQARLVCRVPNLRGYDAEILVGCQITQPEMLAEYSAERLWSCVEQYCSSRQGRRALRGGRLPTPAQVGDWIRWARSARPLRAA